MSKKTMSEPIPILRSFESDGKRYVYGYAAIFDSEDSLGTAMTRDAVETSLPRLQSFPAVHFMHRVPFGQIIFDREIDGAKTFIDDHGFHVLCQIYDECTSEWNMVKAGKWGFSYGFMPDAQGGIETRKLANGHTVPSFVKGTFYEVSVVDAPAHSDAIAYVINRMIQNDVEEEEFDEKTDFLAAMKRGFSDIEGAVSNMEEDHREKEFPELCDNSCKYLTCPFRKEENFKLPCKQRWTPLRRSLNPDIEE